MYTLSIYLSIINFQSLEFVREMSQFDKLKKPVVICYNGVSDKTALQTSRNPLVPL